MPIAYYEGPERRADTPCECIHNDTIRSLKSSIDLLADQNRDDKSEFMECKARVDMDISTLHQDMAGLRGDISTIRADVHKLTSSVSAMQDSLADIAGSLKLMADLPETWAKIKGFWSVMRWLRDNWFLLAIIASGFAWMVWSTMKGFA
jgi:hypothetical protein